MYFDSCHINVYFRSIQKKKKERKEEELSHTDKSTNFMSIHFKHSTAAAAAAVEVFATYKLLSDTPYLHTYIPTANDKTDRQTD